MYNKSPQYPIQDIVHASMLLLMPEQLHRLFDSSHILLADTYGEQIVLRFPFSLVRSPIHQIFRMLQQFLHRLGWG